MKVWERSTWAVPGLRELGDRENVRPVTVNWPWRGTELRIPLLLAWQETNSAGTWVSKLFQTVERKESFCEAQWLPCM